MAMAVASTVVLIRVLMDRQLLDTPHGHVAVGWLIVEDIFTVVVLVSSRPSAAPRQGTRRPRTGPASRSAWPSSSSSPSWSSSLFAGSRVVPWICAWRRGCVARTLHADRAGRCRCDRRRLGAVLRRLDGAGRVPRRHGRRPVAGEPSGRGRRAADARRVRRAVLRLGRHALRPGVPPARAAARPRRRWPSCSSSSPGACVIVAVLGYPAAHRRSTVALGLAQIGEFSFILGAPGPRARSDARRRLQRARRLRHRLDQPQPAAVRLAGAAGSRGALETQAVALLNGGRSAGATG